MDVVCRNNPSYGPFVLLTVLETFKNVSYLLKSVVLTLIHPKTILAIYNNLFVCVAINMYPKYKSVVYLIKVYFLYFLLSYRNVMCLRYPVLLFIVRYHWIWKFFNNVSLTQFRIVRQSTSINRKRRKQPHCFLDNLIKID